jgi:hypothetical protein
MRWREEGGGGGNYTGRHNPTQDDDTAALLESVLSGAGILEIKCPQGTADDGEKNWK